MKRTLHKIAEESLEAYARSERSQWILQWPGQIVLNCSQIYWTKEVIEAIERGGPKGLEDYGHKCTEELNKIVTLVRGQLTTLERSTCGALVVIDVHARDVVVQMAEQHVSNVKDFAWEQQVRKEKRKERGVMARSLVLLSTMPFFFLCAPFFLSFFPDCYFRSLTLQTVSKQVHHPFWNIYTPHSCGTTGSTTSCLPRASPPRRPLWSA
jgi:hypothetical protein